MSTPAEQSAVHRLLRPLRSPCILELGAHTGDDTEWLDEACSEPTHHILVEPDPRNCQYILDRFEINRTRRLIVGAVAEFNGWFSFKLSENSQTGDHGSGSLRMPTGHLTEMPWIEFHWSTLVRTYTLDAIFDKEWLAKIDLLWVDIQGAEDLMIRGGQNALKHTRYLFMEIEKVEMYEGQALRDELYDMLPGWELVQEFEQNALMRNTQFVERGPR